jgi:hypothetical protein
MPIARAISRKRQLSKIQAARLLGLPGISLAQRLAQFQHDLARQNEEEKAAEKAPVKTGKE